MKKTLLFSGLALASLALASCGGSKEESHSSNTESGSGSGSQEVETGKTIELIYAGDKNEKAINQQLFEMFKADRKKKGDKNTYVIDYLDASAKEIDSKVTDWSDDNAPDVFEYASDKINTLFKKGALGEITGAGVDFIEDELNKIGRDNAFFNNSYYGYTFTGDNTYYLQYDKTVLTAEDVKSIEGIAAKLTAQKKKLGYGLSEAFLSIGLLFTYGADYNVAFNEDGDISELTADFNSEKGVKALKAMQKVIDAGCFATEEIALPSKDNNFVGAITGTWDIAKYKEALGDNYACAPMPTVTIDGDTKHLGCFLGTKLMGVNPQRSASDKDRYKAAHEFAMYLAGEEAQTYRFTQKSIAPCHKAVLELDAVKANPNMVVLAEQAKFGHAQGAVPGGIWDAANNLFALVNDDQTEFTDDMIPTALKTLNDAICAH